MWGGFGTRQWVESGRTFINIEKSWAVSKRLLNMGSAEVNDNFRKFLNYLRESLNFMEQNASRCVHRGGSQRGLRGSFLVLGY